jgi:hypothetical protein
LVKPVLRRAFEMRRQIAREGWWNRPRLRADAGDSELAE